MFVSPYSSNKQQPNQPFTKFHDSLVFQRSQSTFRRFPPLKDRCQYQETSQSFGTWRGCNFDSDSHQYQETSKLFGAWPTCNFHSDSHQYQETSQSFGTWRRCNFDSDSHQYQETSKSFGARPTFNFHSDSHQYQETSQLFGTWPKCNFHSDSHTIAGNRYLCGSPSGLLGIQRLDPQRSADRCVNKFDRFANASSPQRSQSATCQSFLQHLAPTSTSGTGSSSLQPLVSPNGGTFEMVPVVVQIASPSPSLIIEFRIHQSVHDSCTTRVNPITSQSIFRYSRPLEFNEPGIWKLHSRLRCLKTDETSPWQTSSFDIKATTPFEPVNVVHCNIRTQLRCLPAIDLVGEEERTIFQQAFRGVVELQDRTIHVDAVSVSFSWPQLDVHYVIYRPRRYASAAVLKHMKPIETVLSQLRLVGRYTLDQTWATAIAAAGLEVLPLSTEIANASFRAIEKHQIKYETFDPILSEITLARKCKVDLRQDLVALRCLFACAGRVHIKIPCADQAGLIERIFQLKPDIFYHLLSFL